jgi:hypothetical protein
LKHLKNFKEAITQPNNLNYLELFIYWSLLITKSFKLNWNFNAEFWILYEFSFKFFPHRLTLRWTSQRRTKFRIAHWLSKS